MVQPSRNWGDHAIETKVSLLLRWGVTLSATVVLVGGVMYLIQNGTQLPGDRIFKGEPADLRQIPGILNGVFSGQDRSIVQLGVILLVLTPVTRVAYSVLAFWHQRDWLYVSITLVVLIVLLQSLLAI